MTEDRGPGPRPVHLSPAAMIQVVGGGVFGAAARELCEQAFPTSTGAFPTATLAVNLVGAFLLGLLLEALVRAGDDTGRRRQTRLVVGTGFMGAFTTYSTFAVEADLLVRAGHTLTAMAYVVVTVGAGLMATVAGIYLGAVGAGPGVRELPFDPDLESES